MDVFINVIGQKLRIATNMRRYVEGSKQFIRFFFNLDSEWDELTAIARFIQDGTTYGVALDGDNSVYLPQEIASGKCYLTLYGSSADVIATTNYLELEIDKDIAGEGGGGGGGTVVILPLTVTTNGEYTAPSGVAYSPVIVETSGTDTSDATLNSGSQMLSGVTAYAGGTKYEGTIQTKSAATYTPGTSQQTIAAGQYLSGTQTIEGDADLVAGNIKGGVTIFGVLGTYSPSSGTDTSDATLTSGSQMLDGYTAYADGVKYTGTIPTKTGSDLTASGRTVTVPSGYYASQATKSISTGSATTPATTITANPTVTKSGGNIVATVSASKGITPTVSAGYVSSGTSGTVTASGSATVDATALEENLVGSNILSGVSIFGVAGSVTFQHYYTGSTAPDDQFGVDGDLYLQTEA